ncbi:MAG: TonB-dependent receptor, partial [Candidatus Dadabacteria bacterium]|nr:TonB-dependent receptor [Candidatus Dadabacteria bacterium]
DNTGYTPEQNIVEAGIDISPMNERFSVGFYGKNLLNEVRHGSYQTLDNPLFPQLGGSFTPLSKGRTFGVQLTYRYR